MALSDGCTKQQVKSQLRRCTFPLTRPQLLMNGTVTNHAQRHGIADNFQPQLGTDRDVVLASIGWPCERPVLGSDAPMPKAASGLVRCIDVPAQSVGATQKRNSTAWGLQPCWRRPRSEATKSKRPMAAVGGSSPAPRRAPGEAGVLPRAAPGTARLERQSTVPGTQAASPSSGGKAPSNVLQGGPEAHDACPAAESPLAVAGKGHAAASAARLLSEACDGWQLDGMALARATDSRPLSSLGTYLFSRLGLVEHFQLDEQKLRCFFDKLSCGYDAANPYHNQSHAASVLHAMHALLEHGGIAEVAAAAWLGPSASEGSGGVQLLRMACLLAAAVHDYEHLGVSNDFLVATSHDRALRYNGKQVNEQHHVEAAFALLQQPECDFLASLPKGDFHQLHRLVIGLVLGTDMATNGSTIKLFNEAVRCCTADGGQPAAFVPSTPEDAVLLLQVAMKCADVGHLTLDWEVHLQWVRVLEDEFFAQGDREKALGLPSVSFLMDREKPGASETQVGFFKHCALPLFDALAQAVPATATMLRGAEANLARWQEIEVKKALAASQATPADC
mmetsp:Transcript_33254/g.105273  ORF Transcript_33254/g.105273 Transcript_33254/m.105273 type:complete len:562 (-) Transcript_33254:99-1784(-)